MNRSVRPPFELPLPLRGALARLPRFPGSMLLATALNVALTPQLQADSRAALRNKRLRVVVRDAALVFDVVWQGNHFAPARPATSPDFVVTASGHDFLQLARRQADPDMLFFNRRLSMEGDTELGLVIKNAIDAMELPVLDPAHWAPSAVLARLAPARARPRD